MKNNICKVVLCILLYFPLSIFAQESTASLLAKAQVKAKATERAIFIKFEASWCGWCRKMTKDMQAPSTKKFFEENYVIVPLVVNESKGKEALENPGSKKALIAYKGETAGLPFWVILDANLNVITNSYNVEAQNLGGPTSSIEVAAFISKLKQSAKNITAKDIEAIKKQFVK